MFKKITSQRHFWVSVLIFFAAFLVLFNLIQVIFQFQLNFSRYFQYYFETHRLWSFLAMNFIGGFIYGFGTAYYRFWKVMRTQD